MEKLTVQKENQITDTLKFRD